MVSCDGSKWTIVAPPKFRLKTKVSGPGEANIFRALVSGGTKAATAEPYAWPEPVVAKSISTHALQSLPSEAPTQIVSLVLGSPLWTKTLVKSVAATARVVPSGTCVLDRVER